jgi:hypothetical protein
MCLIKAITRFIYGCDHKWTEWMDYDTGELWGDQMRTCLKCGITVSRLEEEV